MTKLKDLKKRFVEDPKYREEYALDEELVRARTAAKLTQAEVARRLGTTQWRLLPSATRFCTN